MKNHVNASRTSLLAISLSMAMLAPGSAFAAEAAPAQAAAEADAPATDIIVTGSRLSSAIHAPTPVTIIGAEAIQARAAQKISDVLYELPSVLPNPFPLGTSQAGGNFVVLRGFGTGAAAASRTLVLVDGNRFVPSNVQGQVDLNVIPTALVERVDIVTGGASAAYGSDAVAGVVNVVLKKKLQGITGELRSGISSRGDSFNRGANLAWGTSFGGGRGQFMIAGEYSKADGIYLRDRDYANQQTGLSNVGTAANPVFQIVNGTTINATTGGTIIGNNNAALAASNPLSLFFTSPTTTATYVPGTASPAGIGATTSANNAALGGNGGTPGPDTLLASPLERINLFARASYELSPSITAWAEGAYSRSRTNADLYDVAIKGSGPESNFVLAKDIKNYNSSGVQIGTIANPYLPASVYALIPAGGTITVTRLAPELGNLHTDSRVRVTRFAGGLDGKLGESWKWKASFTYGQTNFNTYFSNNIIEPNLAAAQDVAAINGVVTCRVNVAGQVATAKQVDAATGCVPANPVGPGSLASAASYLTGTLANEDVIKQTAANVELQGSPFKTWAGSVQAVIGADWRKDSLSQVTSPYSNRTNLLGGYAAGEFQQANPKSFAGGVTVKEVFGEVEVPLLRDSALGHALDLNGAVRYSNYSVSGGATTWKIGGTYSPIPQLLFRVVRSRDIRAANLTQLYGFSAGSAIVTLLSPTNTNVSSPTLTLVNAPNIGVSPEVANTLSFGATVSSLPFLRGFSASVDFYKIDLNNFIGQLSSQNLVDFCYGAARTGSTSPVVNSGLCNAAVTGVIGGAAANGRPVLDALAAGTITSGTINNGFLNLGSINTKGIDFEVSYRFAIGHNATLSSRLLATYVDKLIYNTTGLLAVDRVGDLGGVPHWRWSLIETLNVGKVTINATGRYVGSLNLDKTVVDPATSNTPGALAFPTIKPYFYLNMGASIKVIDTPNRKAEFFVNVNNLLDTQPPFTGTGLGSQSSAFIGYGYTNIGFYDVVGRSFAIGLRFKY